ncbi:YxcD family protein [Ammoniphilus resinae]|uniref:DUF2653 family protein n=1 Tax=Ammoniphilus resinae TaxID=861532 RepID=A0ABS4GVA3_9BACL|nr:YxcD family protein [Ammoniphilus resinae]MBP1934201.1 hypothetical protein [Ammoniphilus resinae]
MVSQKLSEQELINAICLHVADKRQVTPQEVSVELMWDEDYGYSAEVWVGERKQVLIESNLIEAVRFYLHQYLGRDPYSAGLEFQFDDEEGITVLIR